MTFLYSLSARADFTGNPLLEYLPEQRNSSPFSRQSRMLRLWD